MSNALPPDRNIGPILVWLTASLDIVAVLLTALRMWIRYAYHKIGWDDWMIVVALACANSRMIFQILQSFHGNGRHHIYLSDEDYALSAKWGWYAQLGLFGGVGFCKISICLLILRIKETKFLKRLLYSVIVGLVLTNGTFVIILLAECSPVSAYWRGNADACWTPKARIYVAYIAVGYGVVTDLLLSLLPAHIVWRLQMPLGKKLLVSGLMALGLVATGFGIARAASLGIATDDLTWDYCIVAIWSNLELFLAITAANLALARSMFFYLRGKFNDDVISSTYHDYSNSDAPYASNGSRSNHSRSKKRSIFDMTVDSKIGTDSVRRSHLRSDDNVVWSTCRRASSTQSATASEIPLEPQIQKRTEVHVHEDARSLHEGDADAVELDAARNQPMRVL